MENTTSDTGVLTRSSTGRQRTYVYLVVLLFAAAVYLGCIVSPPSLMDDVDAVQAQIARNMLSSGDWVTAHLDGVIYLEKAPLIYWMIACCYKLFGAHDWVARIPVALSAIGLCWLTMAFGTWAMGKRAGFYAGLCMSTCIGLFLFTRIQIPDVMQTFTIALAMWALLRVLDAKERRPRLWAALLAASLGAGLLLKSLIGLVFPVAAGVVYLLLTRQLFLRETWKKLRPFSGIVIILAIAAPWHILATIQNPPYFNFTFRSIPGQYHGFFWFYFMNEQVLRFLNLRSPRDYNTVPLLYFWLFNLVWLFPWSVYFPATLKLSYRPIDRAGKTRLMALCWAGFILLFFSFSTTQEYYSMPCYPAFALLLGSAIAAGGNWIRGGTRVLAVITGCCAAAAFTLFFLVWHVPTPGDISMALSHHPSAYTLSLGHMEDLTLDSFAYLRTPLFIAAVAFLIGTCGAVWLSGRRAFLSVAVMMVLFFQAARLALVTFDPYLSSRGLAEKLMQSPPGELIVNHHYYDFSSVFFYTDRRALLLNGIFDNLVYGAAAPDAPPVFINNDQFRKLWASPQRYYLVVTDERRPDVDPLIEPSQMIVLASSGGKFLMTNHPVPPSKG